jgi:hypothetical protein
MSCAAFVSSPGEGRKLLKTRFAGKDRKRLLYVAASQKRMESRVEGASQ